MPVVRVTVVSVSGLRSKGPFRKPDPYVKVEIEGVDAEFKTEHQKNATDAEFNESYDFEVEDPMEKELEFKVKDHDKVGDSDTLGKAKFPLAGLWENNETTATLPLEDGDEATVTFRVLAIGFGKRGSGSVQVVRAEGLRAVEEAGSDCYVLVRTPDERVHRTNVHRHTTSPTFDTPLPSFDVAHPTNQITVEVYHHRTEAADDLLGRGSVDFSGCEEGADMEKAVALTDGEGTLFVSVKAKNFSG